VSSLKNRFCVRSVELARDSRHFTEIVKSHVDNGSCAIQCFSPELPLARRWSFRKYRHASSSEAFNLAEIWIPNQRLFCECKTGVLSHVMWDVVRCRRWFNAGFYLLLKMIQQFLDALGGNSVIFYTSDCPYLYVLDIRFLYIIYIYWEECLVGLIGILVENGRNRNFLVNYPGVLLREWIFTKFFLNLIYFINILIKIIFNKTI